MAMDRERRTPASPLRPVEFHVLLSLAAGARHGYGIIQDTAARGEALDVGTLYRALARMADRGLIAESTRRRVVESDDERRHYYCITARGLRVARAEAARIYALANEARACGLLGVIPA